MYDSWTERTICLLVQSYQILVICTLCKMPLLSFPIVKSNLMCSRVDL